MTKCIARKHDFKFNSSEALLPKPEVHIKLDFWGVSTTWDVYSFPSSFVSVYVGFDTVVCTINDVL